MKMVTLTITENGDQLFLNSPGAAVFCEAGLSTVRRASHVEPDWLPLRLIFRAIRAVVRDTSSVAQWTREWRCVWRVAIVGGPILSTRYYDRKQAINAEIFFLNKFYLENTNG